jgi:hypothetical protein
MVGLGAAMAVGETSRFEVSTAVKGFRGLMSATDWIQGEEKVDLAVTAVLAGSRAAAIPLPA